MWNKYKKIGRRVFVVLALSGVPLVALSQEPQHPQLTSIQFDETPTPNAAELNRYGEIPVSYFTGQANVTIPIFNTVQNGVPLDVYLSYDTSGLLMNNLPGWTGHGWTLHAGGVITRVQNAMIDEYNGQGAHGYDYYTYNYFQSSYTLNNENPSQFIQTVKDSLAERDYRADEFFFNFMGKSGRFIYGPDGEWHVSSDDNLAVVFDVNDETNYIESIFPSMYAPSSLQYHLLPKTIKGFTIYDDQGNKYVFGGSKDYIEYSIDMFKITDLEMHEFWVAKSWYLSRVEDRFGNVLYSFEYVRGKYLIQLYKGFAYDRYGDYYNPIWYSWAESNYSGTLNLPVYLKKIRTLDRQVVDFHTSSAYPEGLAGWNVYPSAYTEDGKSLSMITNKILPRKEIPFYYIQDANVLLRSNYCAISDKNQLKNDPLAAMSMKKLSLITVHGDGSLISKNYNLYYSTTNRLHLTQVDVLERTETVDAMGIIGYVSSPIGSYKLKYYRYDLVPVDYLTNNHDAWGYCRGTTASLNISQPIPANYRQVSTSHTKYGTLTEIIYPTGGKSVLEYEQNDYSSYLAERRQNLVAENGITGGLRIKSISEYEDSTNSHLLQRRLFTYTDPSTGQSSGQLFAKPRYEWNWTAIGIPGAGNIDIYCLRDVPVIPMVNAFGCHIGYSHVRETFADGSYKTHSYTNYSDFKDDPFTLPMMDTIQVTPYDRFSETHFLRGRLTESSTHAADGTLMQSVQYKFRTDTGVMKNLYCYMSDVYSMPPAPYAAYGEYYIGGIYKFYYPKYDISSIITSTHVDNGMVRDTTTYLRNNNNYEFLPTTGGPRPPYFRLCISEEQKRNGNTFHKTFGYPTFNNARPFFTPVVSVTQYINGSFTDKTERVYGNVSSLYVPVREVAYHTAGVPDTLVRYTSYLNNSQLKGYPETFQQQGKAPTRIFWNKRGKQLARITCPYDLTGIVCHDSTAVGYVPANQHATDPLMKFTMPDGTSIFSKPQVEATVYTYNASGLVSSITSGNGYTYYYEYDGARRLTIVHDAEGHIVQRFTYNYATSQ